MDVPKTGEAEYDTYYVDNVVEKIDSGVGTGAIVDSTGITRNVKGDGYLHRDGSTFDPFERTETMSDIKWCTLLL